MNIDLAGKVAIVTGASRGIGLAVAEALVAERVRIAPHRQWSVHITGLDYVLDLGDDAHLLRLAVALTNVPIGPMPAHR